ncbi:PD-(D/E)XK nuclease family protein [Ruminococcus flavefaciens]|uniref:RecB family exonuclease n=1 Tax=Ruminococcus flavefaciens TaxID=1265 RepID=A0A1K1MJU9_RUMFL|nr:PD-(D/E)XK nuclease family protein [Ruminococcus flavefaciens]SFW22214.1 RecB family exonuclease [Ruminococcus flavefaciens]
MREKIILAPTANGTELLRSLALHGINTLCLKIMSSAELAETALMRSGETVTRQYIRTVDEPALIFSFLNEIEFFSAATFADAQNIAAALDSLRKLIMSDESSILHEKLSQGEFAINSAALGQVYDRYITELESKGFIDSIQLIRKAVELSDTLDAEFCILREYQLAPLEAVLIGKLSGGSYKEITLCELSGVEKQPVDYSDITEAYGDSNEAEHIIETIYSENLPLDNCIVAAADTMKYSQLFYDIASQYNIPVTFGCGLPVSNSTSAELMRNFLTWETTGYNGKDSLYGIIFSESFDRQKLIGELSVENEKTLRDIVDIAGTMRLSCDREKNEDKLTDYANEYPENTDYVEMIRLMFAEFEHGCSYIVKNYAVIRDDFAGRLDRSAVNAVCEEMDAYTALSGGNVIEIIDQLLTINVCCENSREGALHITGIKQAMCSLREELFVTGLSADNFPGMPRENYLVPDGDYLMFDENAPTSEKCIADKKQALSDLLRTASSLGNRVHLSYSGYDTAELKEANASSQLFEIFREKNGEDSTLDDLKNSIAHTGFFENSYSASRLVGRAYNSGSMIKASYEPKEEASVSIPTENAFSPSAIETYLSCPRKYYFSYILNMEEPDTDDVFVVIKPLDMGNLVHGLMDDAFRYSMSKEKVKAEAVRRFNALLTARPPINPPDVKRVREDFMRMVENGFESSAGNEVIYSEHTIKPVKIGSIKLKGRLDRLEKTPDENIVIVDYKTGRRVNHRQDDIASCLQILLYAAMLEESEDIKVSGGEYRYLRYNKSIPCAYTEFIKEALVGITENFAKGVSNAEFPPHISDNCRFCGYSNICRKGDGE